MPKRDKEIRERIRIERGFSRIGRIFTDSIANNLQIELQASTLHYPRESAQSAKIRVPFVRSSYSGRNPQMD